jgi:hypothetical protein
MTHGEPCTGPDGEPFLYGGGDKPPCPATEGAVTGVIDRADGIGPAAQGIAPGEFEELIRATGAGVTYANVNSDPCFSAARSADSSDEDRAAARGRVGGEGPPPTVVPPRCYPSWPRTAPPGKFGLLWTLT